MLSGLERQLVDENSEYFELLSNSWIMAREYWSWTEWRITEGFSIGPLRARQTALRSAFPALVPGPWQLSMLAPRGG